MRREASYGRFTHDGDLVLRFTREILSPKGGIMAKKLMKLALLASAVTLGLATTAFAAKEEAKPAPAAAPAAKA